MTATWPLVIYYDASCPLCREEMQALSACDAAERLRLRDASAPGFADADLQAAGIGLPELMRLIHARDAAGRWYRGVEVFELAYAAAGLHGVAAMWAHPALRPLWNRLYPWVARYRQPLSKLRLNRLYGWAVRLAAARSGRKAAACAGDACRVPGSGHDA